MSEATILAYRFKKSKSVNVKITINFVFKMCISPLNNIYSWLLFSYCITFLSAVCCICKTCLVTTTASGWQISNVLAKVKSGVLNNLPCIHLV